MQLTHKELQNFCRDAALSEKAAERLLGSATVAPYQLGLRLIGPELQLQSPREVLLKGFAAAIKEYRNCCPRVTSWIARGDFDPTRLPSEVDQGQILHACRTASRIRAEFIRSLSN